MEITVNKEVAKPGPGEPQGRVVLGNWDDSALLEGDQYDVVLADYLIGAMDGFSPFKQVEGRRGGGGLGELKLYYCF
jgi:hypothetical protein